MFSFSYIFHQKIFPVIHGCLREMAKYIFSLEIVIISESETGFFFKKLMKLKVSVNQGFRDIKNAFLALIGYSWVF